MKKSSYFWGAKGTVLKTFNLSIIPLQSLCLVETLAMNVIHSLAITLYEATNQIKTIKKTLK